MRKKSGPYVYTVEPTGPYADFLHYGPMYWSLSYLTLLESLATTALSRSVDLGIYCQNID